MSSAGFQFPEEFDTVSGKHVELTATSEGLVVKNLKGPDRTTLDGAPIGGQVLVPADGARHELLLAKVPVWVWTE